MVRHDNALGYCARCKLPLKPGDWVTLTVSAPAGMPVISERVHTKGCPVIANPPPDPDGPAGWLIAPSPRRGATSHDGVPLPGCRAHTVCFGIAIVVIVWLLIAS